MQVVDDSPGENQMAEEFMNVVLAVIDRARDRAGLEEITLYGHGQKEHIIDKGGAQ